MSDQPGAIHVPPKGTRGDWFVGLMMRVARPLVQMQVSRYSRAPTAEPAKFQGFPVLLLTTVGAKTGTERTHALGGFPDGDDAWLIVASMGGAVRHPAWCLNLAQSPDKGWAQVGSEMCIIARNKTDREIPVLRVTPAT